MKALLFTALMAIAAVAQAKLIKNLPANDPLARVGKAIGTQLSDGNISTGMSSLRVGVIQNTEGLDEASTLAAFAEKAFTEKIKDRYDKTAALAPLKVKATNFVDGDGKKGTVYAMTSALIEGNAYNDSKEQREPLTRYVWAVLRKMPVSASTSVAEINTVVKDEVVEQDLKVRYFLLVNGDGKAVELLTVEGTM